MNRVEPASAGPHSSSLWAVHRVDDNGNRFVVREHLSRAEAERLVAEFEAHGHKQTYWVEPGAE